MRRVIGVLALAAVLTSCGGESSGECFADGPDGLHSHGANGVCKTPTGGRVTDRIPVGNGPDGLALGAGDLWVANFQGQTVTRVDPGTGRVLAKIPTGDSPVRIAGGFGAMWVANYGSDSVARIDPGSNRVVTRIHLSAAYQPDGIAVSNGSVWVGSASDGSVSRIDPSTDRVSGRTVQTGSDASEITAAFGSLWVTSYRDGVLWRIDPRTGRILAHIRVGGGPLLSATVGDQLWLGLFDDGAVVRIDPETNRVLGRNALGNGVNGIAVMDGAAWVSVEGDEVGLLWKLDPRSGLADAAAEVGVQPKMVVPAEGSLWFPLFGPGRLARFRPTTG